MYQQAPKTDGTLQAQEKNGAIEKTGIANFAKKSN